MKRKNVQTDMKIKNWKITQKLIFMMIVLHAAKFGQCSVLFDLCVIIYVCMNKCVSNISFVVFQHHGSISLILCRHHV